MISTIDYTSVVVDYSGILHERSKLLEAKLKSNADIR